MMELEQYQCNRCGRFFYIDKPDKSGLDSDFKCPYGCDDVGKLTRLIHTEVKEVTEV